MQLLSVMFTRKAELIFCLFAWPSLKVPGMFLHPSLDVELLLLLLFDK